MSLGLIGFINGTYIVASAGIGTVLDEGSFTLDASYGSGLGTGIAADSGVSWIATVRALGTFRWPPPRLRTPESRQLRRFFHTNCQFLVETVAVSRFRRCRRMSIRFCGGSVRRSGAGIGSSPAVWTSTAVDGRSHAGAIHHFAARTCVDGGDFRLEDGSLGCTDVHRLFAICGIGCCFFRAPRETRTGIGVCCFLLRPIAWAVTR
jgi:hypothetical protein